MSATEKDSHSGRREPPRPELAGREIAGRYRIISELGQGGMGAVYRAEQISLKRVVALKLLKPELSAEPGLIRRFNAEAELAAKLSHPNTVTLFDFGQDGDGTLFIAMEFVAGTSLRTVIARDGPLPAERTLAICKQVSSSLADAHACGIIHRDLKPDNVMLSVRGKRSDIVSVLDFGIAKLRDERGDVTAMPLTQAGDMLGTPQYMAPEQIRGETVDGRTDVYALGAMIYEMITGRLPFEAPTIMAILSKHLTEMPVSPASRRADLLIPLGLDQLVMQALQKNPAARPPTMEAFGEHIGVLLDQLRAGATAGAATGGGAVAAIEPRFTTRPPGVPMTAPPLAAAPAVATPPPAIAATPPPAMVATPHPAIVATPHPAISAAAPTAMVAPHPMTAPVPASSRAGLWLGLLAILAVGGGVTAIVLASGSGKDEATISDPSPPPEPPPPGPPTGDFLDGERWHHPSAGFGLIVPAGFGDNTSPNPSLAFFEGSFRDAPAYVMVSGEPSGGIVNDEVLELAVETILATSNGALVSKSFRSVQGSRRMTGVFDVPAGLRSEFVIYPYGDIAVIAMYSTSMLYFADTGAIREELFERRVLLP